MFIFCIFELIFPGLAEFCKVMGAGSSAEVPGGGSEGYHVLRVIITT